MRRLILLTCIIIGLASSALYAQAPEKRPLIVIYQVGSVESAFPIAASLSELLDQTKRAETLIYSPSEPFVQRLVVEGVIDKNLPSSNPNATQQNAISVALGAQASLEVSAQLVEDTVKLPPPPKNTPKKNNLPTKYRKAMVMRLTVTWRSATSNQSWQTKFDSPMVYSGKTQELDRSSSAKTAASTLVAKLIAEPLSNMAMIESTQEDLHPAVPEATVFSAPDNAGLAKQSMEAADRAMSTGDIAMAVDKYRQSISLEPLNPAPRAKLIKALLALKMDAQALSEAKRATLLIGAVPELAGPLADAYVSADQPEEAERLFRSMLEKDPSNVQVTLRLVDVLWNNGRINEAETLLKQACTSTEKQYEPFLKLAHLYALKSQFTEAAEMVSKVYTLIPADDETLRSKVFSSLCEDLYPSIERIHRLSTEALKSQIDKKLTREQLYNALQARSNEASILNSYVASLLPTPPQITTHEGFKLSCVLLKNGLATLVDAITNNDSAQRTNGETSLSDALREAVSAGKTNAGSVN
ncbi:MAG: tetratricopeptide repeat protein [Armatimonadota bacterium]